MRKLFVTALVASIGVAQAAGGAEPEVARPAVAEQVKDDRRPRAAKPTPSPKRGEKAERGEPKPPEAKPAADKPCEPVKPCPIDG